MTVLLSLHFCNTYKVHKVQRMVRYYMNFVHKIDRGTAKILHLALKMINADARSQNIGGPKLLLFCVTYVTGNSLATLCMQVSTLQALKVTKGCSNHKIRSNQTYFVLLSVFLGLYKKVLNVAQNVSHT